MPIAGWRRRCSRMSSGKRASMREGPLAALFAKTDDKAGVPPTEKTAPANGVPPAKQPKAAPAEDAPVRSRASESSAESATGDRRRAESAEPPAPPRRVPTPQE